jgi:hypothetical protein
MAITRPLEFDQTPNRLLYEIGQQARQDQLLQRKLQQDNLEKQYQVLQEVNPATLYPKFEKEVVDNAVGGLTERVAGYIKANPQANYLDLQGMVNSELGKVATWSARVKTIKDNIDKTLSSMDNNAPFDKGRLRALAIDRSLYNTDQNGIKALKNPEEINIEEDVVSTIAQQEPSKVIDAFKGQDMATKLIKDSALFTQQEEVVKETPDGRRTVTVRQKSTVPFYLQAKDGKIDVRRQENGYLDEGVYERFYTNPAMRVWIDGGADAIMNKAGVPSSPEAKEWFKRAFLTDWLENNKKGAIERVDKNLYAKPITINTGQNSGSAVEIYDVYSAIDNTIDSKDIVFRTAGNKQTIYGTPLNSYDFKAQATVLEMVNKIRNKKTEEGEDVDYKQNDIVLKRNKDRSIGVYSWPENEFILNIDYTGTNLQANKGIKAQQKIIGGTKVSKNKLTINRADIPAKASAAGYTVQEYTKLLKERGVIIK